MFWHRLLFLKIKLSGLIVTQRLHINEEEKCMNVKRAPEPFPQDTPMLSLVYIYPGLHIPEMNTNIYIYIRMHVIII